MAPLAGPRRGRGDRLRAAPEYQVFPQGPEPLDFYEAVVHATQTRSRSFGSCARPRRGGHPHARARARRRARRGAVATLIPHVLPPRRARLPDLLARRAPAPHAAGRGVLAGRAGTVARGLELGRRELNEARARLGLPPLAHVHGGISRELAIVATFPQLEYPRALAGPRARRGTADVGAADGRRRAAAGRRAARAGRTLDRPGRRAPAPLQPLRGLADAPVRVLATWNRRLPPRPLPVPANARLVDWVSYARTMPPATSSSATRATARSSAHSPAAARSWPARPSGT